MEEKEGRINEKSEMLKAFISPQNALSKERTFTRNQANLKPSLSEDVADKNLQSSNTMQPTKNPAFASLSTDKLAAKVNKVKAISSLQIESKKFNLTETNVGLNGNLQPRSKSKGANQQPLKKEPSP